MRADMRPVRAAWQAHVPQLSHEHWYKNWGGVSGELLADEMLIHGQ
jgi:hypothetical protein